MINVKAVLLAFMLCTVMPAEAAATVRGATAAHREYWWSMLYPQFCGGGYIECKDDEKFAGEEKIKLKLVELFDKQ